jgi:hypothetical protein
MFPAGTSLFLQLNLIVTDISAEGSKDGKKLCHKNIFT